MTSALLIDSVPTFAPGRRDLSIRSNASLIPSLGWADTQFRGAYKVFGTAAIASTPDVPVIRRVRLLYKRSGRLIREMWTDESGAYCFNNVAKGPWIIIGEDYTGEYNAVIADNIFGELM